MKMKKLRRLVSLLMAMVLVMGTCFSALADDPTTGSITIINARVGETYSIYKMLDMTYNETTEAYSYTVTDDWKDFFTSNDVSGYLTVDQTTGVVTWTGGSNITTFAQMALTYATENNLTATDKKTASSDDPDVTEVELEFANLNLGYYLIDSSVGTLCSVNSTDLDVEVEDKNPEPVVEKEVKEDSSGNWGETNTADVGEIVYFKTEIENAKNVSNLVLHDEMSNGLTLDPDSFIISLGSSQASAGTTIVDSKHYTIVTDTTDGCTFEITFTDDFTATIATSQNIIVEYTATVNEEAVIGYDEEGGNPNETYVEYGSTSESTHDTTITYVYEVYVWKYTETTVNNGKVEVGLEGAQFILYRSVGSDTYYAVIENDDGMVTKWSTDSTEATTITSDSDGLIHISGLDAGTYYLKETVPPEGYSLLAEPEEIVISQTGVVTGVQEIPLTYIENNEEVSYYAIKIYNGSGTRLPSTGGIGTTIFYVVGSVLVIGALVLLVVKRRMQES